jgi:hypothetical protein
MSNAAHEQFADPAPLCPACDRRMAVGRLQEYAPRLLVVFECRHCGVSAIETRMTKRPRGA